MNSTLQSWSAQRGRHDASCHLGHGRHGLFSKDVNAMFSIWEKKICFNQNGKKSAVACVAVGSVTKRGASSRNLFMCRRFALRLVALRWWVVCCFFVWFVGSVFCVMGRAVFCGEQEVRVRTWRDRRTLALGKWNSDCYGKIYSIWSIPKTSFVWLVENDKISLFPCEVMEYKIFENKNYIHNCHIQFDFSSLLLTTQYLRQLAPSVLWCFFCSFTWNKADTMKKLFAEQQNLT